MLARACGKTNIHSLEPEDLCALTVEAAGAPLVWDDNIAGLRRFHTADPVGNRLEFQQAQR